MSDEIRAIAFLLPQFHPIPENNEWWEPGFTEWHNVTRAKPQYPRHWQPHLPADLGFYDLRLPETRENQASMAQEFGLSGFCYYHYWFNGRRVLERPFNEVLESGKPDFPFCLCWANENWTRSWDGNSKLSLLQQNYSAEDDKNHMEWLIRAFLDPRYIRIDGKPVFTVYRTASMPNPKKTSEIWREIARFYGLELFLCNVESNFADLRADSKSFGFDAAIQFQPSMDVLKQRSMFSKLVSRIPGLLRGHRVVEYKQLVEMSLAQAEPKYARFPCLTPFWDNSARRRNSAFIIQNSTPQQYGYWLRETVERLRSTENGQQFIFINAWNEWAEGCHLEPCQRWGKAYLEATRDALTKT